MAQDAASVTFVPTTGNYLLQYTIDGVQYSDTLVPATKIDPAVSCVVTYDAATMQFRYSYAIRLLPSSQQDMLSFSVAHAGPIISPQKPNATWMMLDWRDDLWTWSNSLINSSGLHADATEIGPGESMGGFSFTSTGPPAIALSYFEGNAPGLAFTAEPPALMEKLIIPMLTFPNNYIARITITPWAPPSNFSPLIYIDTLISYVNRSRTLGWISTQQIVNKYSSFFASTRTMLLNADIPGARSTLQTVVSEANMDSASTLTSEAYAIIRYNTEYLLDKIKRTIDDQSLNGY
jgi:hypothetical protein